MTEKTKKLYRRALWWHGKALKWERISNSKIVGYVKSLKRKAKEMTLQCYDMASLNMIAAIQSIEES